MEEHDANNLQLEIIELTGPHQSKLFGAHLHTPMSIINGNFIGKYTIVCLPPLMVGSRHRTIPTEEREKVLKELFTSKSAGIR